jgi:hypothetical protein
MWRPAWVSRLASLVWVVLVWSAEPAAARAQESTAPLREHGCVGCHSLDGAAGQGPSFVGLAGSHRGVYRDGERVTVVADDAYLRRAIEAPDAEIAEGYAAGFMPRFELDETEVVALVAAIGSVPTQPAPSSGTWWPLAVGLFLFVFGHLAMSSAPLRGPLVTRFGEGGFQGLYSLVAFVGLGLIVWGYTLAPYVLIFEPPTWTRWIPNVVMPLAYTLLVMGYTTPSPTMAGMADRAASGPKGIQRITRHPALWGFALWGLAHRPMAISSRASCSSGWRSSRSRGWCTSICAARRTRTTRPGITSSNRPRSSRSSRSWLADRSSCSRSSGSGASRSASSAGARCSRSTSG